MWRFTGFDPRALFSLFMPITYLKLLTQICFYMLAIHVLCSNIKNLQKIEKVLNNDFENIGDWFVDNKLSIHFGEDKT